MSKRYDFQKSHCNDKMTGRSRYWDSILHYLLPLRLQVRNYRLQKLFVIGIIVVISAFVLFNAWHMHNAVFSDNTATQSDKMRNEANDQPQLSLLLSSYNNTKDLKQRREHKKPSRTTISTPSSRPLEMLQEYQRYHNQQALMEAHQKGGIHNRTFIVGFYACPDSAGNRLHEFFYSLIMAIAHNYTITWKFFDEQTCRAVGTSNPQKWCKAEINTVGLCSEMVTRAPWIASYDEWEEKLGLTFGSRGRGHDFYSPVNIILNHRKQEFTIPNDNKVWIPKESSVAVDLHRINLTDHHAAGGVHEGVRDRLKELYSMGTYYLYGMLFHEIFPFHDNVLPSPELVRDDNNETSILIHSRHVKDYIDGSDISKEIECIQKIIIMILDQQNENNNNNNASSSSSSIILAGTKSNNNNNNNKLIGKQKCKFFLFSDRNATIENLKEWIVQHTECIPVTANHDDNDNNNNNNTVQKGDDDNGGGGGGVLIESGRFAEHGPFALKGFFQDLALAAHTNGGYIGAVGKGSSSADLFRELYEYNHFVVHGIQNKVDDGRIRIHKTSRPPLVCGIPKHRSKYK